MADKIYKIEVYLPVIIGWDKLGTAMLALKIDGIITPCTLYSNLKRPFYIVSIYG